MNLRSGLTYIIVNRKTRLVLDDPADEGGFVNVNHLNEDDTQKWMISQGRDGLWTLQNVRNGKFLSIQTPQTKGGDPVTAKPSGGQMCRWSIVPEDSISFRICISSFNCAASLDTSIGTAVMPVVLKDGPSDFTVSRPPCAKARCKSTSGHFRAYWRESGRCGKFPVDLRGLSLDTSTSLASEGQDDGELDLVSSSCCDP